MASLGEYTMDSAMKGEHSASQVLGESLGEGAYVLMAHEMKNTAEVAMS